MLSSELGVYTERAEYIIKLFKYAYHKYTAVSSASIIENERNMEHLSGKTP